MTNSNDENPKTLSVPAAGKIVGLSKNAAYSAARRGEIPTLRFGGRLRVPTYRLEKLLRGDNQTEPTK